MAKDKAIYLEKEEVLHSNGKSDKPWASSFNAFLQDITMLADKKLENEKTHESPKKCCVG